MIQLIKTVTSLILLCCATMATAQIDFDEFEYNKERLNSLGANSYVGISRIETPDVTRNAITYRYDLLYSRRLANQWMATAGLNRQSLQYDLGDALARRQFFGASAGIGRYIYFFSEKVKIGVDLRFVYQVNTQIRLDGPSTELTENGNYANVGMIDANMFLTYRFTSSFYFTIGLTGGQRLFDNYNSDPDAITIESTRLLSLGIQWHF